jgi:rifampicin phosphotransferase
MHVMSTPYVLDFQEIDQTQGAVVGGKGANLGELSRIEGIRVPPGFCVTTHAFRRVVAAAPSIDQLLERLSRLKPDEHEAIRALSEEIRTNIERIPIPDDIANATTNALARLGDHAAYAVRSSATAEDLPTASFAGQQDTYLNISGRTAILGAISRCWASLFTERAVTYRMRNGVDHRKVHMAVVVQQMVFPQASGILFTADPVTGNRKVVSIDASFGLGEALVSGLVNPDVYKVRNAEIVGKTIAAKQLAFEALPSGGTQERAVESQRQQQPALTEIQVIRLAQLGRQIEAHFGRPQDIEWCLVDDDFLIVQSRPITTLFPIPVVADGENHVYVSTGHQQMMTDAIKPLGISVWQLTAAAPMHEAGGRIFVDVSRALASPAGRASLFATLGKSDPLIRDALQTIIDRDFIPLVPGAPDAGPPVGEWSAPIETDPAIVDELIAHGRASIEHLTREIGAKSGTEVFDFIVTDMQERKRVAVDPRSMQVIMAGMASSWWLNDRLEEWIGEKGAADTLTQSVPNNVTSEMGLELLDVADAIRPHPEVVAFLRNVRDDDFLNELPTVPGGERSRDAIQAWLDKYGMRGVGEIDVTRPRWSERPSALLPLILGNIRNFEPGEAERRFRQGLDAARTKETELLQRVQLLPDGDEKAQEVKRMIDRVRTFVGYREYPKYFLVNRYFAYKQGLMKEADRLVESNVLRDREDAFFLTFHELRDVVRTNVVDYDLIRERKDAFRAHQGLTPPRVLTSDGEMVTGAYRRDNVPPGALVGLPVSAGTIEGRARVVFDPSKANLEPGDILVTPYTDPSWTPLFVAIKGLITEVGGLMTHGAVIAREYGLPAVVGVEQATRLITDGQMVRVHGTEGYVEILA